MPKPKHTGFYIKSEQGIPAHILGSKEMSKETMTMLGKVIDLAFQGQNDLNDKLRRQK